MYGLSGECAQDRGAEGELNSSFSNNLKEQCDAEQSGSAVLLNSNTFDVRKRAVICPICGFEVEQKGIGRPRVYHEDCKKIEQLLGWLEDLYIKVAMKKEKSALMRSKLWYLANCLNGKGKG